MNTPKSLFPGARVAILGASSPSRDISGEEKAAAVRAMGFEPVLYPSATAVYGYLAGSDEQRAADLNAAFADPTIDGIMAIRGGYGAPRILPMLDFEMIRKNPKFFGGYSDVTALHIALNQKCDLVTYHMPMVGAWHSGLDAYSESFVKAMLFGQEISYENPADAPARQTLVGGTAKGKLVGGNLSLIAASLGTPYEIDTKGKILFIEEVGESPYRVDGMLTHLRNAGKFEDAAGIIMGDYHNCTASDPDKALSLQQIFEDIVKPAGKPTITGVVCGHCSPSMSLPMGEEFFLDADACTFRPL